MTKSKPRKDNTVECGVCGKQFPRGQLDLNRHMNAITLQHLYSNKRSNIFSHECLACGLCFTIEDHLQLHKVQTACRKLCHVSTSGLFAADNNHLAIISEESEVGPHVDTSKYLPPAKNTSESDARTMECMICGKLFPRGPIDLHRHSTAITLKHLVSKKRTNAFSFGCNSCGLHFGNNDHLRMHETQSTCNPNMVWPLNAATTAGLRAIPRAELGKHTSAASHFASKTKLIESKNKKAKARSSSPISSRARENDKESLFTSIDFPNTSAGQKDSMALKRLRENIFNDLQLSRQKKSKLIVPEERQVFFGIISLIADRDKVPADLKLSESSFGDYLPTHHKPLIDCLKRNLLHA